jgi:hypothetical protein
LLYLQKEYGIGDVVDCWRYIDDDSYVQLEPPSDAVYGWLTAAVVIFTVVLSFSCGVHTGYRLGCVNK